MGFLLGALLAFTGLISLPAKTLTFDQEKCHVDVPEPWTEQSVPGNIASWVSADQTKSFVLRIVQTGLDITVDDPAFLGGVEKSMLAQGVTITNRQPATLAGLAGREIDNTQTAPQGAVYNRMTIVMANGNAYALLVSKLGSPPEQDDELNGIVNSFGFIGTPELHHAGVPSENRLSVLVGQVVGFFVALLAVVSLFKWIRRRARDRSQPPPPPQAG